VNAPRRLSITVAVVDEEHRVHVSGPQVEVIEAERSSGTVSWKGSGYNVSTPEVGWRQLKAAWSQGRTHIGARCWSLLKEAREQHLREFPDCPHRSEGEGYRSS